MKNHSFDFKSQIPSFAFLTSFSRCLHQVVVASFLPEIGTPIGQKPRKKKDIVKLSTPVADPTTVPRTTNTDHQNSNEQSQESPAKGTTNSTPAPNFHHENRTMVPNVHDWRRATTDMNVSLRED